MMVGRPAVRRFAELLRRVPLSETREEALDALHGFFTAAQQSVESSEGAFAAIQRLRDLDVIDDAEAAFLFDELYSLHKAEYEDNDERLGQPISTGASLRELMEKYESMGGVESVHRAQWDRLTRQVKADYHRARGEVELADMIEDSPDDHALRCFDGQWALVRALPTAERGPYEDWAPAEPAEIAAVREQILGTAASEAGLKAGEAWPQLMTVNKEVNVASAVAAAQELRGLGVISPDEATIIILAVIHELLARELAADRETLRTRRLMAGIDAGTSESDDEDNVPDHLPEWKEYEEAQLERFIRVEASCLRHFGEHGIANLLLEVLQERREGVEEDGEGAETAA